MSKLKKLITLLSVSSTLLIACGNNNNQNNNIDADNDETTTEIVEENNKNDDEEEVVNENTVSDEIRITTNITDFQNNYYVHRTVVEDISDPTDQTTIINPGDDPITQYNSTKAYNTYNPFITNLKENPEKYFAGIPETTYALQEIFDNMDDIIIKNDNTNDFILNNINQAYGRDIFEDERLTPIDYLLWNVDLMEPEYPELMPTTFTKLIINNKILDDELADFYQAPSIIDHYKKYDENIRTLLASDNNQISYDELTKAAPIIFENDEFIVTAIFNKEYTINVINDDGTEPPMSEATYEINKDNYNQYLELFESDEAQKAFNDNL